MPSHWRPTTPGETLVEEMLTARLDLAVAQRVISDPLRKR